MSNNRVVIKFGGNALTQETASDFCQVVAQLPAMGYCPVIVHGGGPQIDELLKALNVESHFVDGLRYTDSETLSVAEMTLSGKVNRLLVQQLGQFDANAVGISGKDGKTLIAEKMTQDMQGLPIDLGYVGSVVAVRQSLLDILISAHFIPVVAPIAFGVDGETYNINADYAAAAIAMALKAKHFVMMTNIEGLLDANSNVIHHVDDAAIYALIDQGVIAGGMVPKTLSAIDTLSVVEQVNIIDGRKASNLLDLLSGKTVGTTMVNA